MAISVIPYIPRNIIVHLGLPSSNAPNITVPFPDYVKNVTSCEIYPTWEPSAIRANILAIISYALNRVYTEFYPSQGYNFNITSTTAMDQQYTVGAPIFENVAIAVDEIFDNYIRIKGFVEPLAAKFCNGTTSKCDGMSQWGSQELALKGLNSVEILKYYYGDEIELVVGAPVEDIIPSYNGIPLRLGSTGEAVTVVQVSLNRISQNYPAIPKISPVNGIYNQQTENAIKEFQRIFNLASDGIVGKVTWYKLVYLYVGVNQLSELVSLGQSFTQVSFQYSGVLREGDRGESVTVLQYMLNLLAEFNTELRILAIDGFFGPSTTQAVIAYQQRAGLSPDGIVGRTTWEALYHDYYQLEFALQQDSIAFPESGNYQQPVGGQYQGSPLQVGQKDGEHYG
ncbi:MAG: peptidoglycan-binding protein [Eubacteriales bacterium]